MPASVILNFKDGVYAIDSDSEKPGDTDKNILTWMVSMVLLIYSNELNPFQGTLLEKFITMCPKEFASYMRPTIAEDTEDDGMREAYRYAKVPTSFSA